MLIMLTETYYNKVIFRYHNGMTSFKLVSLLLVNIRSLVCVLCESRNTSPYKGSDEVVVKGSVV